MTIKKIIKKKLIIPIRIYEELFNDFKMYINKIKIIKKYSCTIKTSTKIFIDNIEDIIIELGVHIGDYNIIHVTNYKNNRNSFLEIGKYTYIGEFNNIRAAGGKIVIGEKCLISQHVNIIAANHSIDLGKFIMDQPWSLEKNYIIIGDDVWIGCGVTILPGVKIGNGAIIAAGSIVTKNVDEYTIVGGNPAKYLRNRF